MLPSLLILRAGFLDPIWNIGDELFLLVWLISGVFAIEAFFLKLMAYRCSDTWPIGAVFDFLKLVRGLCSVSSGLSVQFWLRAETFPASRTGWLFPLPR